MTLINNAAVATPLGVTVSVDVDAAQAAFATNVIAPLALTALFIRSFPEAIERRVLNISSGAARTAYAGWGVYCASKAAVANVVDDMINDGLTRDEIYSDDSTLQVKVMVPESGVEGIKELLNRHSPTSIT